MKTGDKQRERKKEREENEKVKDRKELLDNR